MEGIQRSQLCIDFSNPFDVTREHSFSRSVFRLVFPHQGFLQSIAFSLGIGLVAVKIQESDVLIGHSPGSG